MAGDVEGKPFKKKKIFTINSYIFWANLNEDLIMTL